jgi:hypothetical protein
MFLTTTHQGIRPYYTVCTFVLCTLLFCLTATVYYMCYVWGWVDASEELTETSYLACEREEYGVPEHVKAYVLPVTLSVHLLEDTKTQRE